MKSYLLLLLSVFILCFSSCKKNTDERTLLDTYYLTEEDKQNFPFNSNDYPVYDTIDGNISLPDVYTGTNMNEYCTQFPCDPYYLYESMIKAFQSDYFALEYILSAKNNPLVKHSSIGILWFEQKNDPGEVNLFHMGLDLPLDSNNFSKSLIKFDSIPPDSLFIYKTLIKYDSIFINNYWYTEVFSDTVKDYHYPGFPDTILRPVRFYYSSEFGIVKLEMSDGNDWELIQD